MFDDQPGALSEQVGMLGMDPRARRLGMLPYPKGALKGDTGPVDLTDWTAPAWLYELAKAAMLPGHAAQGGAFSPDDVTNLALGVAGGGTAFGRVPQGGLSMSAGRVAKELPMDEASRMARAEKMGFDTKQVYYRGQTEPDITGFRISSKRGEPGVFLTKNADMANEYAGYNKPDSVFPYPKTGAVFPVYVKPGKQLTVDFKGEKHGRADAIKKAIDGGYDSVLLKNHYDVGGVGDQLVMLDPSNIRSRFAAFDPAKSDSSDLLAGIAGAGVLGGAAGGMLGAEAEAGSR